MLREKMKNQVLISQAGHVQAITHGLSMLQTCRSQQSIPRFWVKFETILMALMTALDSLKYIARNTPAEARLIKKYITGNIDLPIMFVLISHFTQSLGELWLTDRQNSKTDSLC